MIKPKHKPFPKCVPIILMMHKPRFHSLVTPSVSTVAGNYMTAMRHKSMDTMPLSADSTRISRLVLFTLHNKFVWPGAWQRKPLLGPTLFCLLVSRSICVIPQNKRLTQQHLKYIYDVYLLRNDKSVLCHPWAKPVVWWLHFRGERILGLLSACMICSAWSALYP